MKSKSLHATDYDSPIFVQREFLLKEGLQAVAFEGYLAFCHSFEGELASKVLKVNWCFEGELVFCQKF